MKYSITKDNQGNPMLFEEGYEVAIGEPVAPELEFWARIQELEVALTEIATRTRRPSKRPGGAAQIVLSAEQMTEIAEKVLNK